MIQRHLDQALAAYDRMAEHTGIVGQGETPSTSAYSPPAWSDPPLDDVGLDAPDIHGAGTRVQVMTADNAWPVPLSVRTALSRSSQANLESITCTAKTV